MTINTLSQAQRKALIRLYLYGEIGRAQWRTIAYLMQTRMIYFDKRARVLTLAPEVHDALERIRNENL